MKIVSNLLCFIIILFSIISCDTKPSINDLQKMNLKGDVILIKEGGTIIFFNDNGNKIKEYNGYNPKNIRIANYFYIEKKLSKTISSNKSVIGNKVYIDESQENFTYSKDGILTSSTYQTNTIRKGKNYYFYENGKLVKDSSNYGDDDLLNIFVNSYFYEDELINRMEATRKVSLKNEEDVYFKYVYFYENGLVVKTIDNEGETFLYEYENDLKGNWIKQKKSNGDISEREIFYKGDDISSYQNKFEEIKKEISLSSSEKIQSNSNSQLNQKQTCNKCQGIGSVSCNDCAGSGQHRCDFCNGTKIRYDDTCSKCRGSGMERCRSCFGSGKRDCDKCQGSGQL